MSQSTTMTIRLESELKTRLDKLASVTHRKPPSRKLITETLLTIKKWTRYSTSGVLMQIKWLRKALKNLDDEAEYIAKDDPQAAQLVV